MNTITSRHIHLKKRAKKSRKGDNGKALIIGGSHEYVGALALAGIAALRSGCDWVTIAAPAKTSWAINCLTPDLVTIKLPGKRLEPRHMPALRPLIKKHDVILLGNGIGTSKPTQRMVHKIIKECNKTPRMMVIDADALKAIAISEPKTALMTPHAGELKTLLKNSGSRTIPTSERGWKALQRRLGRNILLIKGPTDRIMDRSHTIFNKTHDPAMTVAGTGDVLAGLCAGFLAQGHTLFDSACYGAYFNGLTGRMLTRRMKHESLIASDLARDVGNVINAFKKKRRKILE